jgi:hypothetical protein
MLAQCLHSTRVKLRSAFEMPPKCLRSAFVVMSNSFLVFQKYSHITFASFCSTFRISLFSRTCRFALVLLLRPHCFQISSRVSLISHCIAFRNLVLSSSDCLRSHSPNPLQFAKAVHASQRATRTHSYKQYSPTFQLHLHLSQLSQLSQLQLFYL